MRILLTDLDDYVGVYPCVVVDDSASIIYLVFLPDDMVVQRTSEFHYIVEMPILTRYYAYYNPYGNIRPELIGKTYEFGDMKTYIVPLHDTPGFAWYLDDANEQAVEGWFWVIDTYDLSQSEPSSFVYLPRSLTRVQQTYGW